MKPTLRLGFHLLPSALVALLLPRLTTAQSNTTLNSGDLSKRGLLYIGTDHPSDNSIFTSSSSPLTWYYNYASSPAISSSHLSYVPMIHSLDNLDGDISAIRSLSNVEYVLIFNEPDGTTDSGGSNISPRAAARAFIEDIMPMRDSHDWKISLPATTGSGNGLNWLSQFNESCYALSRNGCAFDFVAAHWYGDFQGMASWLGTLHALYPGKEIWLTEFALPQASEDVTVAMMNQSLPFLDDLEWVAKYAWFGAFRRDDANEWTGDGVSLFDADGGLTQAGAVYAGGTGRGFQVGQSAGGHNVASQQSADWKLMAGVLLGALAVWS